LDNDSWAYFNFWVEGVVEVFFMNQKKFWGTHGYFPFIICNILQAIFAMVCIETLIIKMMSKAEIGSS